MHTRSKFNPQDHGQQLSIALPQALSMGLGKNYTIQITPIRGASPDCATSKSPLKAPSWASDFGRGYQYRKPPHFFSMWSAVCLDCD
jgi:hypothetical protein